jgi:hypothetical protein
VCETIKKTVEKDIQKPFNPKSTNSGPFSTRKSPISRSSKMAITDFQEHTAPTHTTYRIQTTQTIPLKSKRPFKKVRNQIKTREKHPEKPAENKNHKKTNI